MSRCGGELAVLVGSERPAMSVSFEGSGGVIPGYLVFFAEYVPGEVEGSTPEELVCVHCLIEEGDTQVARGLELARAHGQVDFDPDSREWFVP